MAQYQGYKETTKEQIQRRLEALGFGDLIKDIEAIEFCSELIFDEITANLNRSTIPDKLWTVYIDMCCGEFLQRKYVAGDLDDLFPNKPEVTDLASVQVGKVSVGLNAGESPRARFESFINDLRNQYDKRYLFHIFRVALY